MPQAAERTRALREAEEREDHIVGAGGRRRAVGGWVCPFDAGSGGVPTRVDQRWVIAADLAGNGLQRVGPGGDRVKQLLAHRAFAEVRGESGLVGRRQSPGQETPPPLVGRTWLRIDRHRRLSERRVGRGCVSQREYGSALTGETETLPAFRRFSGLQSTA